MDTVITFGDIKTPIGRVRAVMTPRGLGYLSLPSEPAGECEKWLNRWFPRADQVWDDKPFQELQAQLTGYFAGELRQFNLPLDLRGTPFQLQVWRALQSLEYGKVCSYAQIAAAIGRPKAVRAVGGANGANPVPIIVPCHRVIASDGTLGGYSSGLEMKRSLLKLEGVSGLKGIAI
jgi:epoxyqueuosine reductase